MIIANPLYDVVFKYLLEDAEIARGLLSTILGEDVLSLEVKPQETAIETGGGIHILRFDFHAVIQKPDGKRHKVLIELQKAKQAFDVMRFRRYLSEHYRKEDLVVNDRGTPEKRPLPIVTIYLLGFQLDSIAPAVVKINRQYRDAVTQEVLDIKEDFVELLTHDSYLIQVRRLAGKARSKLERVLQVFSPVYQTAQDRRRMDFQGETDDPLVRQIVDRLGRAIASEEIRDKMDVEDELDRIFEREIQKYAALIAEKEALAEAQQRRAEEQQRRAEAEIQKNLDLQQQIEALKKQLGS
ncbi:MAG: hypothetical protein NW241_03425 [Bacteroidia bacterium]|nr:hypothetical protein [Bacteroidia bacterium]